MLEIGPRRRQDQHLLARNRIQRDFEKLKGGRIDPMQILEYEQQRPGLALPDDQPRQQLHGASALLRWREIEGAITLGGVDTKQGCEQARVFLVYARQPFQFAEPRLGAIGRLNSGRVRHLLDDRMKSAVGVIGRTLQGDPGVIIRGNPVDQGAGDAGLADARLAADDNHLAEARFRPDPEFVHQPKFLVAADDRRESPDPARLEAAFRRVFAEYGIGIDGLADAFQGMGSERLQLEDVTQQASGFARQDQLVRLRQSLQPRREVGGFADNRCLLRGAAADEVANDHHAGGHPHPARQGHTVRPGSRSYAGDDRQSGANGPFSIILVGARPAEIAQHAVAHELGGKPFMAGDHPRHAILVAGNHLAHVLGIDSRRHLRRADKIDEHDRQVAPLGS